MAMHQHKLRQGPWVSSKRFTDVPAKLHIRDPNSARIVPLNHVPAEYALGSGATKFDDEG